MTTTSIQARPEQAPPATIPSTSSIGKSSKTISSCSPSMPRTNIIRIVCWGQSRPSPRPPHPGRLMRRLRILASSPTREICWCILSSMPQPLAIISRARLSRKKRWTAFIMECLKNRFRRPNMLSSSLRHRLGPVAINQGKLFNQLLTNLMVALTLRASGFPSKSLILLQSLQLNPNWLVRRILVPWC